MTQHWLVKSEPEAFSYDDLERDGFTHWDGVRNYQARNNLAAMQEGDLVLMYHSISDKAVVGVMQVSKAAYPDPSDETGKWIAVGMVPVCRMAALVTLADVKASTKLAEIPLIKQSRLSVMPMPKPMFDELLRMGKTTLPKAVAGVK